MLLAAAAATFVAAAVGSATGFGFALVLSPVLFALLDPYKAVTAVLGLGILISGLVLFDGGRLGPVRWPALAPVVLAALPGMALGAWLLSLLSKPVLQVGVGAVVLAAAVVQWRARQSVTPREGSLGWACAVGLTSGALNTSIGVSGPPIVLWLRTLGLTAAELRASLAATFLTLNVVGMPLVVAAGGTGDAVDAALLLPLLAVVVVGHLAGARAFRSLDERRYSSLVLALIAAAGLASVVAGVAAI
jgi:uncharacterized protein